MADTDKAVIESRYLNFRETGYDFSHGAGYRDSIVRSSRGHLVHPHIVTNISMFRWNLNPQPAFCLFLPMQFTLNKSSTGNRMRLYFLCVVVHRDKKRGIIFVWV